MKRKLKFSMILIILVSSILLLTGGNSQATLQANPNTHYKETKLLNGWVPLIRTMENTNGAMGLAENRNADLTSTEETVNNIDVHCMKTTEYGAIAILSASGYGNPSNDNAIVTTTGNNTGMMLNTSQWEWTAGIASADMLAGVNPKYYDLYGAAKRGDALAVAGDANPGCAGWHGATTTSWIPFWRCGYVRGSGGIFSFYGGSNRIGNAVDSLWAFGRGVAVCGEGL